MTTQDFASDAWLLEGWTVSIPGWLALQEGRLSFTTDAGVVFDVPREQVAGIEYPWYYFGGGMKLLADGKPYRLSFVKPNGAEYAAGKALAAQASPLALLVAASKLSDVGEGRALGRHWRALLGD